jgi:hypothetical protein
MQYLTDPYVVIPAAFVILVLTALYGWAFKAQEARSRHACECSCDSDIGRMLRGSVSMPPPPKPRVLTSMLPPSIEVEPVFDLGEDHELIGDDDYTPTVPRPKSRPEPEEPGDEYMMDELRDCLNENYGAALAVVCLAHGVRPHEVRVTAAGSRLICQLPPHAFPRDVARTSEAASALLGAEVEVWAPRHDTDPAPAQVQP